MKKGFTLVEVLGVIVILAIIAAIVIPVSTSIINKSTNNLSAVQLQNIRSGASNWATDHIGDIPGASTSYTAIIVTLQGDLVSGGYLPNGITDLTTKEAYQNVYVTIMYEGNHLVYDIYENATLLDLDSNRSTNYPSVVVYGTSTATYTVSGKDATKASVTPSITGSVYTFVVDGKTIIVDTSK